VDQAALSTCCSKNFFNSVNPPLNIWSVSDWYFSGTGLPVPKWANDAGIIAWDVNGIPYVR
jgi:hypothetical protein